MHVQRAGHRDAALRRERPLAERVDHADRDRRTRRLRDEPQRAACRELLGSRNAASLAAGRRIDAHGREHAVRDRDRTGDPALARLADLRDDVIPHAIEDRRAERAIERDARVVDHRGGRPAAGDDVLAERHHLAVDVHARARVLAGEERQHGAAWTGEAVAGELDLRELVDPRQDERWLGLARQVPARDRILPQLGRGIGSGRPRRQPSAISSRIEAEHEPARIEREAEVQLGGRPDVAVEIALRDERAPRHPAALGDLDHRRVADVFGREHAR